MKRFGSVRRYFPLTYRLVTISILLMSAISAGAQSMTDTLTVQAKQQADAVLNKDYETAVLFMYPPIIRSMGGYKKALEKVKKTISDLEANGGTVDKIAVGQPSAIVQEGLEHVVIVPTKMEMSFNRKKVYVSSYLVAITQDRGKHWYFLDGAAFPEETLAQIYPKLVFTVEIPKRKNSLEDEINNTLRRIEEKEGKPNQQLRDEQLAESRQVIKKIEENDLRQYIERREGKKLEEIPIVRLKELLKELKIE